MAIVTGAYFSIGGSGQVGDSIQIRRTIHGSHAFMPRARKKQNQGAPTHAQRAVRTLYAVASAEWATIDPTEAAIFRDRARHSARQVSGWNVYFRDRAEGQVVIDGGAPASTMPAPATLDGRAPQTAGIWLIDAGVI